jgi:glutamate-5-semialdehyde dehydrogenase
MNTKIGHGSNDLPAQLRALAQKARDAARGLAVATTEQKNAALTFAAEELDRQREALKKANAEDLAKGREKGLAEPMLDRLKLDDKVLARLKEGLLQVVSLPDPIGGIISQTVRPNGLRLRQVRVPIGTIFIIFESRPNVTVEAGSLCLKSGNACILRGGSEAFRSNQALGEVLRAGLQKAGLPVAAVSVPATTDRTAVSELLRLDELIDVVIPRGGESLIRAVVDEARMPVIKHYKGICHVYVDKAADPDVAEKIVINSKLQRVSVCNAAETLLVHKEIAPSFLPRVAQALLAQRCELRCEPIALSLLAAAGIRQVTPAAMEAFSTEYLDRILSVRVVDSLDEAIDHIERYGSRHTETIVTRDETAARCFQQRVDSSSVFWNASTRFSDGFEFGLGAEIGISTDKIHARGPMGLESLTTYKWLGDGTGQLRS